MPKAHNPRKGSMQFWPRRRASRPYARIGSWSTKEQNKSIPEAGLLGFAGYKVGMTHVHYVESNKNSHMKGMTISLPVTVVECPPLRIASVRLYQKTENGWKIKTEILASQLSKDLKRKITLPKKQASIDNINLNGVDDIRVLVYTEPSKTSIGKKKPEIFEMALTGKTVEDKMAYVKENINKPIEVDNVFSEGVQVDIHSVTKGKGFQGPVKRFGVAIREHKAEKTKRGPGSLGPWISQAHITYRVAHAGQMGYHVRTEYNKQILLISDDAKKINPDGGFVNYGLVRNKYILLAGSVPGARKRLVRFNYAIYPNRKVSDKAHELVAISTESKQR